MGAGAAEVQPRPPRPVPFCIANIRNMYCKQRPSSKNATIGAPGIATRSKKLLGAPGIATRSKEATRGSWPSY